ncbi:MAG: tetratricopeptide repeat protein [Paracoccaceae bacterium]
MDDLFSRLKSADEATAVRVEREIELEWSKSGSPSMDLLLQRGKDALDNNQPEVAIEHLTALIDHDPDFAEGWNARASAWIATGDLGPAVDDLSHALTLNPRHFGALASLGLIFEEINKPEKALEAYRAALELNPQMADVKDAAKRLEGQLAGQDI